MRFLLSLLVGLGVAGGISDTPMNEPRDCDVALIGRLASGYCSEGRGSYSTIIWHTTEHPGHLTRKVGPLVTVGGFSEVVAPRGTRVERFRLQIRTRIANAP